MKKLKSYKDIMKEQREEAVRRLNQKLGLYYTLRSALGINWAYWYWLIGARGRGKSFSVVDTIASYCQRYGQENVKTYYFRISDLSVKAMLANKGRKTVDAIIQRKYKMELSTNASTLFNHGKPFIDFYALVSAAKTGKGVAEYDPDFLNKRPIDPKTGKPVKRFIFIVIDEFMIAEGLEKKSIGNPVEQFKIFVENILRDQERIDYKAVMVFGCANSVSECNDFLAQLVGFIPQSLGRFRLKRKHTIVDNIVNSEAYEKKRRNAISADIMNLDEDSNYTNQMKRDWETIMKKGHRLIRVTALLKFTKDTKHWFCEYDGKYIRRYKGETVKKDLHIAMRRYLDTTYNAEMLKNVFERYDARDYMYTDMISQATFTAELKEIKKQ